VSNTTIAAVFVPVLMSIATADPDFNAVKLVLPAVLAATFGYSLPSASGRMALIAASGIVTRIEMMRYRIIMTGVSALVLALDHGCGHAGEHDARRAVDDFRGAGDRRVAVRRALNARTGSWRSEWCPVDWPGIPDPRSGRVGGDLLVRMNAA